MPNCMLSMPPQVSCGSDQQSTEKSITDCFFILQEFLIEIMNTLMIAWIQNERRTTTTSQDIISNLSLTCIVVVVGKVKSFFPHSMANAILSTCNFKSGDRRAMHGWAFQNDSLTRVPFPQLEKCSEGKACVYITHTVYSGIIPRSILQVVFWSQCEHELRIYRISVISSGRMYFVRSMRQLKVEISNPKRLRNSHFWYRAFLFIMAVCWSCNHHRLSLDIQVVFSFFFISFFLSLFRHINKQKVRIDIKYIAFYFIFFCR